MLDDDILHDQEDQQQELKDEVEIEEGQEVEWENNYLEEEDVELYDPLIGVPGSVSSDQAARYKRKAEEQQLFQSSEQYPTFKEESDSELPPLRLVQN